MQRRKWTGVGRNAGFYPQHTILKGSSLENDMQRFHSVEDSFKISDINFVLTVPAIWDDTAKMFMREAAIKVILSKI